MSIIIGKNGVYNFVNTIKDEPLFENGLTEKQVKNYIRKERGINGLKSLPGRLLRVEKQGTSKNYNQSLEEEVSRFLENENITMDEFILKYLTIKEDKCNNGNYVFGMTGD